MSLVGTRPPTVDEWEQYELHHRSRMSIKPGITGMWQASGRSDITDFEEVVKDIAAFPRQSRFYHAIIDSRSLKSGEDFGKLKQVYVIFICNYDPFGYDRVLYTIKNRCLEEPEMDYSNIGTELLSGTIPRGVLS